jgi:hypothetical protein
VAAIAEQLMGANEIWSKAQETFVGACVTGLVVGAGAFVTGAFNRLEQIKDIAAAVIILQEHDKERAKALADAQLVNVRADAALETRLKDFQSDHVMILKDVAALHEAVKDVSTGVSVGRAKR